MSLLAYHGDCLEIMKQLPDKSISLFMCDLPYGCLAGVTRNEKQHAVGQGKMYVKDGKETFGCSWDVKINLDEFWKQVERLAKNDNTPVLHFCTTRFGFDLIQSKPDWFRYDLVWNKTNAVGFLAANKQPMRAHELIYVFSKKGAAYTRIDVEGDFPAGGGGPTTSSCYNTDAMPHTSKTVAGKRCPTSVIKMANKKKRGGHPTAKPVDLYTFLIERYCPAGETVLDPTFGSGNSCCACSSLGRKWIGIEKDKTFYDAFLATHAVEKVTPTNILTIV